MYPNVQCSIIHNSQRVGTTQISTKKWMVKQNVVYTYNGILFSCKKEWNPNTCYKVGEIWKHYTKWNKPETKGQILYDSNYAKRLEQANS